MNHFVLTRVEYDMWWEHLDLGEFPTVLTMKTHGATMEERAALSIQAQRSVRAKGYTDGPGRLVPDLEDALTLFSRPERYLDARLRLDPTGPMTRAMAAATGQFAALAVLTHEELHVQRISASRLGAEIVGLLPAHPPGPRRSITVSADVLDRAAAGSGQDPAALEAALVRQGVPRADGTTIARVMSQVIRLGQFGATYRLPKVGRVERAPHVVSFYDTPEARFQFTRRFVNKDWSATLSSGETAQLTTAVDHLLDMLIDQHTPRSHEDLTSRSWLV